jgi:hypothetical protein
MTKRLDLRNRPIRTSEYHRDLRLKQSTAGKTQRKDTCLICYTTFPTDHKNVFVLRGPDGTEVRICYHHITDITNQPGTFLRRLSLEQAPNFDLVKYINENMGRIRKKDFKNEKVQATFGGLISLLDLGGISRFLGGPAELVQKGGIKLLKHFKPAA